jgi:hypothetical protein
MPRRLSFSLVVAISSLRAVAAAVACSRCCVISSLMRLASSSAFFFCYTQDGKGDV